MRRLIILSIALSVLYGPKVANSSEPSSRPPNANGTSFNTKLPSQGPLEMELGTIRTEPAPSQGRLSPNSGSQVGAQLKFRRRNKNPEVTKPDSTHSEELK